MGGSGRAGKQADPPKFLLGVDQSMDIDTKYGQYWDMTAVSQANILHQLDDVPMRTWGLYWLHDRLAKLSAGRIIAKSHVHVERKLQEVDRDLKLRWEFDHPDGTLEHPISMFAIDRYVRELGYHWTIFFWSHTLGEGIALREILKESDMQRPEYHREKKVAQELTLERNKKIRDEMALAAIDQLSDKQCQNFVAVETALRTGEKIHVRGKDAELLNRMYENTKKLEALGFPGIPGRAAAINPGMDPVAGYNRGSRHYHGG
jgi:hypothetical protein